MAKHNHQRPHSDQLIRRTFGDYLRSGMHIMLAFAKTACEYNLSLDTIRKIVVKRKARSQRLLRQQWGERRKGGKAERRATDVAKGADSVLEEESDPKGRAIAPGRGGETAMLSPAK